MRVAAYFIRWLKRSAFLRNLPCSIVIEDTIMGMLLDPTPKMGEYSVEVRRESFYITGEDSSEGDRRHAFHVYHSRPDGIQGTVEILIEDIPKIRAALDQVEAFCNEREKG